MKFPCYDKQQYRNDLLEQLRLLGEMANTPSETVTQDTVINAMRLYFEIKKEVYRLDHEKENV